MTSGGSQRVERGKNPGEATGDHEAASYHQQVYYSPALEFPSKTLTNGAALPRTPYFHGHSIQLVHSSAATTSRAVITRAATGLPSD